MYIFGSLRPGFIPEAVLPGISGGTILFNPGIHCGRMGQITTTSYAGVRFVDSEIDNRSGANRTKAAYLPRRHLAPQAVDQ